MSVSLRAALRGLVSPGPPDRCQVGHGLGHGFGGRKSWKEDWKFLLSEGAGGKDQREAFGKEPRSPPCAAGWTAVSCAEMHAGDEGLDWRGREDDASCLGQVVFQVPEGPGGEQELTVWSPRNERGPYASANAGCPRGQLSSFPLTHRHSGPWKPPHCPPAGGWIHELGNIEQWDIVQH